MLKTLTCQFIFHLLNRCFGCSKMKLHESICCLGEEWFVFGFPYFLEDYWWKNGCVSFRINNSVVRLQYIQFFKRKQVIFCLAVLRAKNLCWICLDLEITIQPTAILLRADTRKSISSHDLMNVFWSTTM